MSGPSLSLLETDLKQFFETRHVDTRQIFNPLKPGPNRNDFLKPEFVRPEIIIFPIHVKPEKYKTRPPLQLRDRLISPYRV